MATVAQWQVIPSGTTDSLTAITCVDDRFLITGGGRRFLRSMDNGLSFTATNGHATGIQNFAFDHLAFHDPLVGYGSNVGSCCTLQSTTDGGLTWQTTSPGTTFMVMRQPLNATDQVIFKSGAGVRFSTIGLVMDELGIAIHADLDSVCPVPGGGICQVVSSVGDTILSAGSHGWTMTSNDRGTSIQTGTFPYAYYPYHIQRINDTMLAYIDMESELRISMDKGVSWKDRSRLPINPSGLMVSASITPAFAMASAAHGAFADVNGLLRVTADSGMTWTAVPTPTNVPLNDLLFIDDVHVLAVGDAGTILSSSDGGYTWQEEESGTTARLHALALSDDAVIAVGNNGVILRRYPAYEDLTTTVSEANGKELRVFPNPASATVTVHHSKATSGTPLFTATDALGRPHRLRVTSGGNGSWSMDVTPLANGAHILEVLHNGDRTRSVFMVAH